MATKNLFNVPSFTSIQELFFRRLGIALDPNNVSYTYTGATPIAVSGQVLPVGTGDQSVYPLTVGGTPVISVSGFSVTRQDWDGLWTLSATPYTNVIPDSDNFAGEAWGSVGAVAVESSTLYGGVMPYWAITSTTGAIGQFTAGFVQFGLATVQPGETWTATVALRATASSNLMTVAIGGANNETLLISSARFVSGPGTPLVTQGDLIFNPDTGTGIGSGVVVQGLSTAEDSLLEIVLHNTVGFALPISVGVAVNTDTPITSPVSVLATRMQLVKGGPLPYRSSGDVPTAGANYSISGGELILTSPLAEDGILTWAGSAVLSSTITVTANPTTPDGSKGPYTGSITYPINQLQISRELPPTLVWSDDFPMTVDALASYLMANYGYYMEDGEFIINGDPSATPLVRGGSTVYNGMNTLTHTFQLQAISSSVRWKPGSLVTFTVASSNSIVPPNGFAITSGAPPDGALGTAYTYTYTVVNGTPPYTFKITDGNPPGSLNAGTGVLSSPELDVTGLYSWIIQVEDAKGRLVTRQDQITVAQAAFAFNPDSLGPFATVGEAFTLNLGVSGGQPPYTYSLYIGSFPSGVGIVNGTVQGVFEGNLGDSTQATVTVGIQVEDTAGTMLNHLFNFTINDRTDSDIQASLCAKVLHWFEYDFDIYGGSPLVAGTVVYDATGRANMQVANVPGTVRPEPAVGLAAAGRNGQPYAFAFGNGAYLHNNTTAFNLPNNFSLMALVNFPTSPVVAAGQKLISRGADAFGGYELEVGADGSSLALNVTLNGVPTNLPFPSQITPAFGTWYFAIVQNYGNIPEMEINAGSTVQLDPVTGNLTPNNNEFLYLGIDPALDAATLFGGNMGMVGVFTDKLWSDERKWLYNQGELHAFQDLGFFPELNLAIDQSVVSIPLGEPFERNFTISGGSGVYIDIDWQSGSNIPPGLSLTYDGDVTVTISGTATKAGSYSFGITVTSTDGQTDGYGMNDVPVMDVLTPINELPLSTAQQFTDLFGASWVAQGDAVINTVVDPNGALYLDGISASLATELVPAYDFAGHCYTVVADVYPTTNAAAYMLSSPIDLQTLPIVMGLDGGTGDPGSSNGLYPYFGWYANNAWSTVRGTELAALQNSWNTVKGVYNLLTNSLAVFVNEQCAGYLALGSGVIPPTFTPVGETLLLIGESWNSGTYTTGYMRNVLIEFGLDYDTLSTEGTEFSSATVGMSYSGSIPILGGAGAYANLVITGTVPDGLTLTLGDNSLILSGTPTESASSTFSVSFQSSDGQTLSNTYGIVVTIPTAVWDPAIVPEGAATISGGGYILTPLTTTGSILGATLGKSSGKWTYQVTCGLGDWYVGIAAQAEGDDPPWQLGLTMGNGGGIPGESMGFHSTNGFIYWSSQLTGDTGVGGRIVDPSDLPNSNDILTITCLLDLDSSPQTLTTYIGDTLLAQMPFPEDFTVGLTWNIAVSAEIYNGTFAQVATLNTGQEGDITLPAGVTGYTPHWA